MSELKNLIKPEAHDPYHKYGIVPYLAAMSNQHIAFFEYMAKEGFDKYNKADFLRKTIMKYSKDLFTRIKNEDQSLDVNRNYMVAPNLTDEDIQNIVWKWQGNVMEIIAGYMFMTCNPFNDRYSFDEMCGDDKNDVGVDGWLRSTTNRNFFIGIQVKYRFEKDVKWNDQITKALALTDERVRKLYQANQLTDQDWCIWGKQIQRRAVLVTTTKLSDSVTNAIGTDAFDVIDETVLLEYIGKKNNVNPNKEFWETLFERIYK